MDKVKIKVYEHSYEFIKYLISNHIYYESLESFNDYYILIVCFDDYKRISRKYKCSIVFRYGVFGLKNFIIFNRYMIVSIIFSFFILFLLCNTIFDVRVNCNDEEVKLLLLNELKNNNIYKYRKKKSFNEIELIKKKILNSNKDYLEWIEISDKGSVYYVDVTPKIKHEALGDNGLGSIYSKYNAVIKYYSVNKGSRVVDVNDYVKKGDLLISGNILKDDTIIDKVKASGRIYGEVWYTSSISVPLKYKKLEKTNRVINHYYLDIFGHKFTLIGKYDSEGMNIERKLILSKPYLPFKIYKEIKSEYKYIETKLSNNEAFNIGIVKSDEKIRNMLQSDEYVISKKVLKKEVSCSKMVIEVFYKIYRNIGYTSNIDLIGEKNEFSNKDGN